MLRYKEIKSDLVRYIAGMNNGERLPSRTVLSKKLDVSRATLDKAINELEAEGILESKFGSGTYVARKLEGVQMNAENWCLIVPDITEAIYANLAGGVENYARERGVNMILCNSESKAEKQEEYIKRLTMAGIAGFIIVPVITHNAIDNIGLYQSLRHSKIPFVFCNREVEGVGAPVVKSNDFYGGYIATKHLLKKGYKNIAYLARDRYRTSIDRCQGYVSALQEQGISIERKKICILDDDPVSECRGQARRMMEEHPDIDAFFCFNDSIAMEVMKALEDMDKAVSDDIGIIGYDNIEASAVTIPPLTSVAYRTQEVGKLAASVLSKMIDGAETPEFSYYLVQPEVVERGSCMH